MINPNGIVFGSNSLLNIGGSFIGTTADSINFADGTIFSAKVPQTTPLLTVSVPLGLQMGQISGDIQVEKQQLPNQGLGVSTGKTLGLLGGNLILDGGALIAPNGEITLGGIVGGGTIELNLDSQKQTFTFPDDVTFANVLIKNGSQIFANNNINNNNQNSQGILTQANQLMSSQVFANNNNQNSQGFFIQPTQLISSPFFTNNNNNNNNQGIFIQPNQLINFQAFANNNNINQNSQGIFIQANQLIIEDGSQVSATNFGTGSGSNITVKTSESIEIFGSRTLDENILTSGLFTQTEGSGDAGKLDITTGKLIVENGGQITAGTADNSQGNGGTLTINADAVEISGKAENNQDTSGIFARSRGTGRAGEVNVNTNNLTIKDGAQVTVSGLENGQAGNLKINANSIKLDQGNILAGTSNGDGGNITLQNLDLLLLNRNSLISAEARNQANGGNVNINAKDGFIVAAPGENSDILANAAKGNGGNINIIATSIYGLVNRTQQPIDDSISEINATSEFGLNGTVELNTPDIQPEAGLTELPSIPIESELAQGCYEPNYTQSRFVITGRGGLPTLPEKPLTADSVRVDWVSPDVENQRIENLKLPRKLTRFRRQPEIKNKIVEATGWIVNQQGEVLLTATANNTSSLQAPIKCK
ncbi:MAG: filamentous hemagglutinin [Richelia sp. RM1_1_1]|nr:filamentous hemagglutinin [Richelia sp. RM1_1_1]